MMELSRDLLDFNRNLFSQNGEDGVIERILNIVGQGGRTCCEFGASDGVHLSNTRRAADGHGVCPDGAATQRTPWPCPTPSASSYPSGSHWLTRGKRPSADDAVVGGGIRVP
jgi:hypothetical protein